MSSLFRVAVRVPVADEATAAMITERLQEASTIQTHIGAWVMRQHQGEPFTGSVLVDFTIVADTVGEARARALDWARTEVARGDALPGVGEPRAVGVVS
jgi:hypothetical protein